MKYIFKLGVAIVIGLSFGTWQESGDAGIFALTVALVVLGHWDGAI